MGMEKSGCPVIFTTRSYVLQLILASHTHLPNGYRRRGELSVRSLMGMYTLRLLQTPTVKPVKPAIMPCTTFSASSRHWMLSKAFAGTLRIMYDGSMYFTDTFMPLGLLSSEAKYSISAFFRYSPTSGYRLFPLASVLPYAS